MRKAIALKWGAGVRTGLRLKTKQRAKVLTNGEQKIFTEKRFKDVQALQVSSFARIGFGRINLIGYYSLTPLLKSGKGLEIHPYSIGISINEL